MKMSGVIKYFPKRCSTTVTNWWKTMELKIRQLKTFAPLLLFILVVFAPLLFPNLAQSGKITFFAQPYFAPYNFEKEGKIQGISVDLLLQMHEQINSDFSLHDIEVVPWARAYSTALEEENTAVLSITKTKKRNSMFKWVGPVAPIRLTLFAKREKKIIINSLDEIKNYKIGVIRDGFDEQFMINNGIDKESMDSTKNYFLNIKKLTKNRFDIMLIDDNVMKWHLKIMKLNPDDYKVINVVSEGELYFAFQKDTDDSIVQKYQMALDKIKNEGGYQQIIDNYMTQ